MLGAADGGAGAGAILMYDCFSVQDKQDWPILHPGFPPASSDSVESEGRQMKQC
jgi:hypothetical protein